MVPRARGVAWPGRRRAPETVAPGPRGARRADCSSPDVLRGMVHLRRTDDGADLRLRRIDPAGKARKEVRTFGTMTRDLIALSDRMADEGVTHVAMESTGVYWK